MENSICFFAFLEGGLSFVMRKMKRERTSEITQKILHEELIVGRDADVTELTQHGGDVGGVKESGIGREGGKYGTEEFLDYKFLSIQLEV